MQYSGRITSAWRFINLNHKFGLPSMLPKRMFANIAKPFFTLERLNGRSLIRVQGAQAAEFLQSLITNDMNLLTNTDAETTGPKCMFTMFLNKAGRVLYDSIIYKPTPNDETYLVECDREIETDLQTHLKIFRVRKKIDIDLIGNERSIWVAFRHDARNEPSAQSPTLNEQHAGNVLVTTDPRLSILGSRIIVPSDSNPVDALPSDRLTEATDDQYQLHRYNLGIGEGILELPVGKCFPLESNCDFLNGVSFHKGCYLGQEFTARTHHTGVVRKRLLPVKFEKGHLTSKSSKHVESTHGAVLGKIRGFHGDSGLALLKYEAALQEESALVFGGANDNAVTGKPSKPCWWPQDLQKR